MKIKGPALYRKMRSENILPSHTISHLDYTITGKHHGINEYFSPLKRTTNTGSVLRYSTIFAGQ